MSITVETSAGAKRVFLNIEGIDQLTRQAIRQTWFALGKDMRAEANREILRRPKSGRVYIVRARGGRARRHVASAPGETHANLSGDLRRSISWKVFGTDSMAFGYGVSTTFRNAAPKYSPFVEFGTSRMAARPSLENAINATQRNAERHFIDAMDRGLR